ncbi:hypothetical protein [Campylobacter jejuni]|nr:hypothetical protein [Campylobacter jejuni]HEF3808431.1 hypothetical protein [Campylobacter jejuni]
MLNASKELALNLNTRSDELNESVTKPRKNLCPTSEISNQHSRRGGANR